VKLEWLEIRERVWESKLDVTRGREPWGEMRAIAETIPDMQGIDYVGKPRSEPEVWSFSVWFEEHRAGVLDILDGPNTTFFTDTDQITWTLQVVFQNDELHDQFKRIRAGDTWQALDGQA
jgi:hypothetical protein